ncbi:MAG: FHA domain-containing protein [Planctomycetaceae bacterium]
MSDFPESPGHPDPPHVLVILSGRQRGRRIELPNREGVLGREEGCLIRLNSAEVSRRHCTLTPTDAGLLLRDCGSQNGTFVNRERLTGERLLQGGDRLQVGPFLFEIAAPPVAEVEAVEESVLGWLAETTGPGSLDGDTTVLHVPSPLQAEPPPEARPGTFRTLAEEARDVLREWHARNPPASS